MATTQIKKENPLDAAARFLGCDGLLNWRGPGDYKVFTLVAGCVDEGLLLPKSIRDALVEGIKDLYFYMFDPEDSSCPDPENAEQIWKDFQEMETLPD